jgi:hypothetical protein
VAGRRGDAVLTTDGIGELVKVEPVGDGMLYRLL